MHVFPIPFLRRSIRRTGVPSSEADSLQYFLNVELLLPHHYCQQCHAYMELKPCAPSMYPGCFYWSCTRNQHFIYSSGKYPVQPKHYLWPTSPVDLLVDAARIISMNDKTVWFIYKYIRQCIAEYILDNGSVNKIGGPGHMVEIDESKFGKRKYNHSRRVVGKWIFGGYCHKSSECFLM